MIEFVFYLVVTLATSTPYVSNDMQKACNRAYNRNDDFAIYEIKVRSSCAFAGLTTLGFATCILELGEGVAWSYWVDRGECEPVKPPKREFVFKILPKKEQ